MLSGNYNNKNERGRKMRKIIAKSEYDTDNAEFIKKRSVGSYGDSSGYEECLFRREDGKYFLYVSGGPDSPYPDEDIKRISAEKVKEWLEK